MRFFNIKISQLRPSSTLQFSFSLFRKTKCENTELQQAQLNNQQLMQKYIPRTTKGFVIHSCKLYDSKCIWFKTRKRGCVSSSTPKGLATYLSHFDMRSGTQNSCLTRSMNNLKLLKKL
jgi:hypothetical protein